MTTPVVVRDMAPLADLILSSEDWLMRRVLGYADARGYTRYTATVEEAWRISIHGLSESLVRAVETWGDGSPEMGPDDGFRDDPCAAFGVLEARKHRERGVPLGMFLGLMKYYRQSYVDLVASAGSGGQDRAKDRLLVERFFDRVEIAFCLEWSTHGENALVRELQEKNRVLVDEKNLFVSTLESLPHPAFLLDANLAIRAMSLAGRTLLGGAPRAGAPYYSGDFLGEPLVLLREELAEFIDSGKDHISFEKSIGGNGTARHFSVQMNRMVDVNGAFTGSVVVLTDISQRVEAQEKARKLSLARERQRRILEQIISLSPEHSYLIDARRTVVYASAAGLRGFWKTIGEVEGRCWKEGLSKSMVNAIEPDLERAFETGERVDGELHIPEGEKRVSFEYVIIPIRGPKENVESVLISAREVTSRWETLQALRESEDRFRRALEEAPFPIAIHAEDGEIILYNRTWIELSGYEFAEISTVGDWVEKAYGIARKKKVMAGIRRLYAPKSRVVEKEFPIRTKGGNKRTWDFNSADLGKLPDGRRIVITIARDVTGRRQVENALRGEKSLLMGAQQELLAKHNELSRVYTLVALGKMEWEGTMDCVGEMVVLADSQLRIKRCNRPFHQFIASPYTEIVGADCAFLLSSRGIQIDPRETRDTEIFHKATGRWFNVRCYAFVMHGEQIDPIGGEEFSGTVITLHDVTERKRNLEEIAAKNEKLNEAYQQLQMSQARILQQEKMASIGQLAAGVAHEINNPMGFISSNLRTLHKYSDRLTRFIAAQAAALPESGDAVESVRRSRKELKVDRVLGDIGLLLDQSLDGAERVRKIVQDLKSFSRVDQADFVHADVNECLTSTINIVWNEIKYKATLHRDLGPLPQTKCYPQQINQVFMNLLVNAAQAIENHGEIRVKSRAVDGFAVIEISDSGCGIPPDHLPRLFEPFFTTKEVGKGTGLGLSIAYDIVKKHNGEIAVHSEVGRGTTFTVKFPLVEPR